MDFKDNSLDYDKQRANDNLSGETNLVASSVKEMKSATENNNPRSNQEENEDELFGRMVTAFLKKRPESKKKNNFKKKIFIDMMDYDSE